jgi:7,8-dihydropterin-6-yl-methyl-4-(beta-D-ribofuranosyl)aminobenzene 5'-phosphate synthase
LEALKVDLNLIDHVALSHWHRDHSGGILEFLKLRKESSGANAANPVTLDVHPSRPFARGIAPPPKYDKVIARLPEDPTFEEMKELGASVVTSKVPHTIQNETVFISGEIPREVSWEQGLLGSVRWFTEEEGGQKQGGWVSEPVSLIYSLLHTVGDIGIGDN